MQGVYIQISAHAHTLTSHRLHLQNTCPKIKLLRPLIQAEVPLSLWPCVASEVVLHETSPVCVYIHLCVCVCMCSHVNILQFALSCFKGFPDSSVGEETACSAGDPSSIPWVGKVPWRRDRLRTPVFLGFPCGSAGKESARNGGNLGSIPGLGKSPGEGNGYPLQYSGLENSMGYIVHGGPKELDITE